MKTIEELRIEINKIDEQITKLFSKRMNYAKEIAKVKHHLDLPITDEAREKNIIKKNSMYIEEEIREYYIELLQKMIELSKQYQINIIDELE